MIRSLTASVLCLFSVTACGSDPAPGQADAPPPAAPVAPEDGLDFGDAMDIALPAITDETMDRHLRILASDDFEGRAPATEGGRKTRRYLIDAFEALGLDPANGDSFEQPVGLVEQALMPQQSSLAITLADGTTRPLDYGEETVFWTKRVQPQVTVDNADLVFVGFGVVAPEYGWNDYEGVDVEGKTVVILVNDPGFYLEGELFSGRAMTYYGRWTYKFEEAARQGAAAAIIVHETAPAAYGWGVVQGSWSGPQLDLERDDNGASRVALEGWITHDVADELFGAAGLSYETMKQAALAPDFSAVPMAGLSASATLSNAINRSTSANVAAMLPGAERPDEYVLFMAHWDHLGRSFAPIGGGDDSDLINNGAIDNATGTAGLLAIAESFAEASTPPDRSVLFLAVTAEESGLLGSAYYGENPLVPLAQTVGGINMDAILPSGQARDLIVVGYGASELEDVLRAVAEPRGLYIRPDASPEKGSFYRSDHISLAKKGVPMLYADKGIDLVEGGEAAGRAMEADYTLRRYHKPADNYDEDWELSGLIETVEALRDTGKLLAYSAAQPNWYDGNEFRALRDAQLQAASQALPSSPAQ